MAQQLEPPESARVRRRSFAGRERAGTSTSRMALLVLAAAALYQGLWAQFWPRSFFEDFPGGMSWVAAEGPYNEHLVRDVGGLVNGLAVVALVAAWSLSRQLLLATALAWLAYAVPHSVFHLLHPLDEPEMQTLNVIVLALEVALPVIALMGARSVYDQASEHGALNLVARRSS